MSQEETAKVGAIVLAAGKGTRMKSALPKVLHQLGDRTLVEWVVHNLKQTGLYDICLVLGPNLEPFRPLMERLSQVNVAIQLEQKGTADAAAAAGVGFAAAKLPPYARARLERGDPWGCTHVIITVGDTPRINPQTLKEFITECQQNHYPLGVLGMVVPNPTGYGRLIVDDSGSLVEIVEEKVASEDQKKIQLCNSGVIFAELPILFQLLSRIEKDPIQGEYLLTDCFSLARQSGLKIHVFQTDRWREFVGINDPSQLAEMRRDFCP